MKLKIIKARKNIKKYIKAGWKNSIKCSSGKAETILHRILKFWVANFCWENSIEFYTEAVFHDNQRADVIISDWGIAIEILHTEDLKKFLNKQYPIRTIPILSSMLPAALIEMMEDLQSCNGDDNNYYATQLLNTINSKNLIGVNKK